MANVKPEKLTDEERQLLDSGDTREVYVNPLLHRRLKLLAAGKGKSIGEIAEEPLWPLVGGKPKEAQPATKGGKP